VSAVEVTPEGLHILQHSLGLDRHGRGRAYRNRYVAGSDDAPKCEALVEVGLMQRRRVLAELTGDLPLYMVTPAGEAYVRAHSPPAPKLSRSQRRYEAFLNADCGLPFGEWLRRGGAP
jgi:hypothetical protein